MIGVRLEDKDGNCPVVLIGIDRHNVEKLKAGLPMRVSGSLLGLNADVIVAYGERLQDIIDELGHSGVDVPARALDVAKAVDQVRDDQ